jgi:hypothetical protein
VDYVHTRGRDLGWRIALNQRNPGVGPTGPRQFADLNTSPASFTIDISDGKSEYNGVNFGVRRRMTHGLSMNAWYSLAEAKGTTGQGVDELNGSNIVNHLDPYSDVQFGPSGRTDARHRMTLLAVWQAPYGITVSPIYRFRSALPVATTDGRDLNQNGVSTDLPATAYAFDGVDDSGKQSIKEIGTCETINCGRGASQSSFSLRVSKSFNLYRSMKVEAIGEIFNLFNAKNPGGFGGTTARVIDPTTGAADPTFLKPTVYSGDFQQPEQRIGQIGFRFVF